MSISANNTIDEQLRQIREVLNNPTALTIPVTTPIGVLAPEAQGALGEMRIVLVEDDPNYYLAVYLPGGWKFAKLGEPSSVPSLPKT